MNDVVQPGVKIVAATEADLPAIAELAGVIWRAHYPGIISHEQIDYMLARMYSLETLRAEIVSEGIRFERLLVDGALVGFASYGPTREPVVMKLHKLYLHQDYQGRGLGRLLLQHCEREARRRGALQLILAVIKQNARAIAAYKRNGFAIMDSVVTDIGGGFVMDDYIMGKNVGD